MIFQVMRWDIDVVYLTRTGQFKCRLSNMNGKMVKARLKQYERAMDGGPCFCGLGGLSEAFFEVFFEAEDFFEVG